jgi:predicted small metal-binding protein
MDINCLDMGTTCDQVVTGDSTDELVLAVIGHMRLAHGKTDAELGAPELREIIIGAIWQSSRPPDLRTPRPGV